MFYFTQLTIYTSMSVWISQDDFTHDVIKLSLKTNIGDLILPQSNHPHISAAQYIFLFLYNHISRPGTKRKKIRCKSTWQERNSTLVIQCYLAVKFNIVHHYLNVYIYQGYHHNSNIADIKCQQHHKYGYLIQFHTSKHFDSKLQWTFPKDDFVKTMMTQINIGNIFGTKITYLLTATFS